MPKRRSRVTATTRVMRWYLSGGDEECPHCGQLYAYELEFRCSDCDAPSCRQCKCRHPQDRFVCPECVSVTGEDAAHGG